MHPFYRSSFGSFLDKLFKGIFTKPSHESFLLLSLGFVFAFTRHSVAQYLWPAAEVLWFAQEVEQQQVALTPYQPWYEQKAQPSLHEIVWAVNGCWRVPRALVWGKVWR